MACAERGLAGAVVISRGGAQTDSYADVLYLSNHYNVFPLLPDHPPHWSGHSHSAIVIGREGEPTLVDGFGEVRPDLEAVEDVRVSPDLPAGIVAVMGEKGMAGERGWPAGARCSPTPGAGSPSCRRRPSSCRSTTPSRRCGCASPRPSSSGCGLRPRPGRRG